MWIIFAKRGSTNIGILKRIRPFLDNVRLVSLTPVQFCLYLIIAMRYGIHVLSTTKTIFTDYRIGLLELFKRVEI